MNSEPKQLQLTEAQRFNDQEFLNSIKDEFINPLVEELEEQIEGYSDMNAVHRRAYAIKRNEPLQGVGDFLPLGDSLVYAGIQLGKKAEYMSDGITFMQYLPRFWGEADGFHSFVDDRLFMGDSEYFLTKERERYDSLPPEFKAAFLCRFIKTQVIVKDDWSVISFVLGASDELETSRYSIAPIKDAGHIAGWNIRIADVKPDKGFWNKLFYIVCNYGHVPTSEKRQRMPDERTELACTFVNSLERQGIVIDARKGGIGWANVVAQMEVKLGDKVRHYEPDTLSRVYRAWKKRHDLS